MANTSEEILQLMQIIFENLKLNVELDDIEEIYQEKIYIEIFKEMFPFVEYNLQTIENSQCDTGSKIQQLIDFLSTDILTMDLSHIKGKNIAEHDQKHLGNFLQIILELSKLYNVRNEEQEQEMQVRSATLSNESKEQAKLEKDQQKLNDRMHSVAGINQEFQDLQLEQDLDGQIEQYQEIGVERDQIAPEDLEYGFKKQKPDANAQNQLQQIPQQAVINQEVAPNMNQFVDIDNQVENELKIEESKKKNQLSAEKQQNFQEGSSQAQGSTDKKIEDEVEIKGEKISEVSKSKESSEFDHRKQVKLQQQQKQISNLSGSNQLNNQNLLNNPDGSSKNQQIQEGKSSSSEKKNKSNSFQQQQVQQQQQLQYNVLKQNQQSSSENSIDNQQQQQQISGQKGPEQQVQPNRSLHRTKSKQDLVEQNMNQKKQVKQQMMSELFPPTKNQQKYLTKQAPKHSDKKKKNELNQKNPDIQLNEQEQGDVLEEFSEEKLQLLEQIEMQLQQNGESLQDHPEIIEEIKQLTSEEIREQLVGLAQEEEQQEQQQANQPQQNQDIKINEGDQEANKLTVVEPQQQQPVTGQQVQLVQQAQEVQQGQQQVQQQSQEGENNLEQQAEQVENAELEIEKKQEEQDENSTEFNMQDIISKQIMNVKDKLKNMREYSGLDDDDVTSNNLIKQRNQYKSYLKDYLQSYQQNVKKQELQGKLSEKNLQKKMRALQYETINLQKEYENEQVSLYYKLRDEKITYLRKIHKIIFELEKAKIIDEKNQYKEQKKQRNEETRNVLESIENAYKDRINLLKENLQQKRKERYVAQLEQREVISRIQREFKKEKERQISELKDLWRQEKERFDQLVKDDGELEQQIMTLYAKN